MGAGRGGVARCRMGAVMEHLDDSYYLEPPSEPDWCEEHDCERPCQACKYEESD